MMENNKIWWPVTALLLIALTVAVIVGKSGSKTITVTSSGTVLAKPETVSIIATKVEIGNDLTVLMKSGSDALDRLGDVAKKSGGKKVEIRRSLVQVTPQAEGKYIVANGLSIKIENAEVTESLIKDLYDGGATTVSNVDFGLKEGSAVEADARNKALEKSKDRAGKVAEAMGKKLGGLLSVVEDEGFSISGDENQIEVSKGLTVIYEVK